jgi:hypothetical protein
MNLGVPLKAAEKVFGPALPGPGIEENTLSAVRYPGAKAKRFAGISGVQNDASFYIHFPTPVDWSLLETKKGVPDFVSDLKESGPQGEQGRAAQAAAFLNEYQALREKLQQKREAAARKAATAKQKEEIVLIRQRLVPYVGEQQVNLTIGTESISISMKIAIDKSGKLKFSASL